MSGTLLQSAEPAPPVAPATPRRKDPLNTNAETRATLRAMYDRKLAGWPVPFEELDVATSYGNTHVIVAGKADAPPLIMFHMTACPAFIWTPIIAPLAARYRTFAVDIIGDFGKSELAHPARHPKNGAQMAAWAYEVADALRIDTSHVIGASYGGWLAMQYASRAPKRVSRLALIVPMGLPPWPQTLRVIVRLTAILLGRAKDKTDRTLAWMMGDDPVVRALAGDWMRTIIDQRLRVRVPNPFPVSSRQLELIQAPTLIVLGARDQLIGDACRAASRAWSHIRTLEIEIFPKGTHSIHAEEPDRVVGRVLEFLGR